MLTFIVSSVTGLWPLKNKINKIKSKKRSENQQLNEEEFITNEQQIKIVANQLYVP